MASFVSVLFFVMSGSFFGSKRIHHFSASCNPCIYDT